MFGIKKVNKGFIHLGSLFIVLLLGACANETKPHESEIIEQTEAIRASSKHFEVVKEENSIRISIKEPFVGSSIKEDYLLYPRGKEVPNSSAIHKIAVPVRKIAIHSTTHVGFLSELDKIDAITAASNLSLYYDSAFNARIKMDSVRSIGNRSLNTEALIESEADVIFSFVIDAAGMKEVEKLRSLGQNVILISEYMENSPLNKAEWIKVFASFFDEETQLKADKLFEEISAEYQGLKNQISLSSYIPSVMIGFPWKGTWYVSGGDSYQAQLIRDASASYPWNNIKSSGSIPLTLEEIYAKALTADVWINPGSKQSFKEILAEDKNFGSFKAFKERKVYTNYKRSNELGANDYWESGVVHPELILKDLSLIFRSDSIQEGQLHYYQTLR